MIRFIMPIILIGISVTAFFMFTKPFYDSTDTLSPGVVMLNAQIASYDKALDNSQELAKVKDSLTKKENDIDQNDLEKLTKLLPESVDNIRLILEIEQIAFPYGMALKDVKYNVTVDKNQTNTTPSKTDTAQKSGTTQSISKDYGVWDLEFSTTGTYDNFLNFTRDLESNLRIVDTSSIQFSSNTTSGTSTASDSPLLESYKYNFKIKTYWLKN